MTADAIVGVDIDGILNQLQDAALTDLPMVQIDQAQAEIVARLNAAWAETDHLPTERAAAAQAHLTQVWADAEQLLTQSRAHVDMIRQAGAATAVLVSQRDRYADDLSDLSEAVYDMDADHPMVGPLVEEVEQNTMSWYGDMVTDDITEAAHQSLMSIDGATDPSVRRFLDRLILQDGEWTTEQEYMLAGLLGTFADARVRS